MSTSSVTTTGLINKATKRIAEDLRVRVAILMNDDWRSQIVSSMEYFESGKEGYSLHDIGRE